MIRPSHSTPRLRISFPPCGPACASAGTNPYPSLQRAPTATRALAARAPSALRGRTRMARRLLSACRVEPARSVGRSAVGRLRLPTVWQRARHVLVGTSPLMGIRFHARSVATAFRLPKVIRPAVSLAQPARLPTRLRRHSALTVQVGSIRTERSGPGASIAKPADSRRPWSPALNARSVRLDNSSPCPIQTFQYRSYRVRPTSVSRRVTIVHSAVRPRTALAISCAWAP